MTPIQSKMLKPPNMYPARTRSLDLLGGATRQLGPWSSRRSSATVLSRPASISVPYLEDKVTA